MNSKLKDFVIFALISIFNYIPIKRNKIFLMSYYGSQFGCNPKYITEYILGHEDGEGFDVVWAFNNPETYSHLGVRTVRTMSLRYFYEMCTSKVIITNYRTTTHFKKRKNQYYIQTWHSSLRLKQIEKDAEAVLPNHYIEMAKKDSAKCDLLISGSRYSTEIFRRSFWYKGEIFEKGTPRNDLLFQRDERKRKEIMQRLRLHPNLKVVLYAPTFRKDNSLDVYDVDYKRLRNSLQEKFSGDWVVLVRLHPHLQNISRELTDGENVMNVTTYDDIQELLVCTDILISDYSSLIFDFAITGRPCFLYIPDVDSYIKQDRELYFDLEELPFITAYSNDDLEKRINSFQQIAYRNDLQKFLHKVGTFEAGNACDFLFKRIYEVCHEEKRGEAYEAV
ncbi:CDP-glycerol glycerophosphotransferase family protein [Ornithinibacillus californiensis]|uniref:CDP-glycerol glycerophosphotransferase family protein n=1 Tax=Ornithinibacillus californiensis TaxID=161536 RepID=UPI00064DEFDD|nr:CDP-glycerol glycerophosphotransferase family protein [Ornithinibacillus californiensis]